VCFGLKGEVEPRKIPRLRAKLFTVNGRNNSALGDTNLVLPDFGSEMQLGTSVALYPCIIEHNKEILIHGKLNRSDIYRRNKSR
jgi:hypothetical protein